MILSEANAVLRRALNLKGFTSYHHRMEIEKIARNQPHTIRFMSERADETCAPFALRLTDDQTYRAIARHCNVFAGRKFMTWAIARLKEIAVAQPGCLVCYFSPSEWQHVGVMSAIGGRVLSKWGTYPLYEHGIAEVSEEYGDSVRFFERPSPNDALSLFLEFARASGLSNEDIAEARDLWSE